MQRSNSYFLKTKIVHTLKKEKKQITLNSFNVTCEVKQ